MIFYNTRYKGPLEYDKYVLNILQLANESFNMKKEIEKGTSLTTLQDYNKLVNKLYMFYISLSEMFYNELSKYTRR